MPSTGRKILPQRDMSLLPFTRLQPRLVAGVVFFSLLAGLVPAQWTTESFALKAGYNAIWLPLDCTDRTVEAIFAGKPEVIEVWEWNAATSSTQFTESPAAPSQPDSQWKVWKRGLPAQTTLSLLRANAAYLVRVADGTATYTLTLKGKPVAPRYRWKSSGVNFVGFPISSAGSLNFTNFLGLSEVLGQAPPVYYYNGGNLASNPRRLVAPNTTPVVRGQAYWVQTTAYTDYYGPLKVSLLNGDQITFGSKLNTATIRLKNVTNPAKNQTVTATLSLHDSEAAPGSANAPAPVPLRVRGVRDANLQFTYTDLPSVVTLAPGEEIDLILDPDRTQLTEPGQFYASVLRVRDSLTHTSVDLGVSAVGSSRTGVWLGGAIIDRVERVELIRGPEFDAPLGTPDGEGPESTTSRIHTVTTANGLTAEKQVFEAAFDGENRVYLPAAGLAGANVVVTRPSGTPVYAAETDYRLLPSARGTVARGGSGYTVAPTVTISGGGGTGATAYALLSAAVTGVSMTAGGVGYTSAPTVVFSGDGTGATGVAIVNGGLVTDITVTNGGQGYSYPPTVEILGGGGSGAEAEAAIGGSVGSVIVDAGGLGYTGAPQVSFSAAEGSGAVATVQVLGGAVTGVDVVEKIVVVSFGGEGYTAVPEVVFSGGGGTGATATAALSASLTGITVTAGGTGYTVAPSVTISGDGTGATGVAILSGDAVSAVTLTHPGTGYTSAPTIEFTGGEGSGAAATASIIGSVSSVTIDEGGSGYTSAPAISFTPTDGNGAGAVARATVLGGAVSTVRVEEQVERDTIGAEARFSVTAVSAAPVGTPEETVVSAITSTSRLVTLNGKSHLATKRISTGGAAAAPSLFPIRLILHTPPDGASPTLLQQVYLGQRDGQAYAGRDEDTLAAIVTAAGPTPKGNLGRISSASFPRGEQWGGTGVFGGTVEFTVALGYDAETNPFVHTYHPDHDNWDARYEQKLPEGRESFDVTRRLTLVFSPTPPPGVSDLTWGVTTLGGTYTEIISGLRSEEIGISGNFILQQVSEVPALTATQP